MRYWLWGVPAVAAVVGLVLWMSWENTVSPPPQLAAKTGPASGSPSPSPADFPVFPPQSEAPQAAQPRSFTKRVTPMGSVDVPVTKALEATVTNTSAIDRAQVARIADAAGQCAVRAALAEKPPEDGLCEGFDLKRAKQVVDLLEEGVAANDPASISAMLTPGVMALRRQAYPEQFATPEAERASLQRNQSLAQRLIDQGVGEGLLAMSRYARMVLKDNEMAYAYMYAYVLALRSGTSQEQAALGNEIASMEFAAGQLARGLSAESLARGQARARAVFVACCSGA